MEFVKSTITYIRTFFRERLHYQAEDLPYYITIILALILFIVGLNAFVDITQELAQNQLTNFDNKVTEFFVSRRRYIVALHKSFCKGLASFKLRRVF